MEMEYGWCDWLLSMDSKVCDDPVLIVDEAQESYWDTSFWVRMKDIDKQSRYRIITLASYGSTGSDPAAMVLFSPPRMQVVGLDALDHGDGIKVGLLLSKGEFADFVEKKFHGHCFDEQFLDGIHQLTAGHVGACQDILATIQMHTVSHVHRSCLES